MATPDRPMHSILAAAVPRGAGWVHELKHDGCRILARIWGGTARLSTRTSSDYTRAMAPITATLALLLCREAMIDGKVAAPDEVG